MKITSRPWFYIALFLVSLMSGFGTQRAIAYEEEAEAGLDRQCSYDTGSTPRCQYCDRTCRGTGWVCCSITVGPGVS
jgi:hypothetical protein